MLFDRDQFYPFIPLNRTLAHAAMARFPKALGLIIPEILTEEHLEELAIIKELTTPVPLIALISLPFSLPMLTSLACFGIEGVRLKGVSLLALREIRSHIDQHRLGMILIASSSESEKKALEISGAHIALAE